ncbi:MAG: hypothetical protein FD161_2078 [Limisphaerales bacterium]|nr:MAG: hypothetical protein FD161_2078 [Limisphaerales bacterium]KAG0508983.1 MAG: hypothetical protein E1N63_1880 [Limisphaerales bacterium]TXT51296.1 MAG: hypothetical protein FD140_1755 [Limisphaerales bacterium]
MTSDLTSPDPRPETPDPTLADWFTPLRFAAFLLLAFIFAFPGIWMGTETFFRSDYGVMAYPATHYLRESIRAGELPLWNPLSNCGAPFLAQWGTMCLYPGSLFFVALPMPWALGVFCLLHLWLGGLGARALAERWTGNRFAAAVAGTAFAINGASLACITWPNYCVALGWMPWIVLLTEQAWREGGRKLVLAVLAGTMQMLTGVPELVVMTWGLLGVLLVADLVKRKADNVSRNALTHYALRFTLLIALITALSAAQLLPFFDLLAHSQRDAAYRDARWPMPPWGWANFLVPLFRYGQTPQGFWIQIGQEFLSSYYLGLAPLALALLAVWKTRERRVWLLAGVTLFALVMALGDAGLLYSALKNILSGSLIARFPVKFALLAAFTVPLLAAFGVAWLTRNAECADAPPGSSRREEAPSSQSAIGNRQSAINQSLLTSAATCGGPNRSSALLAIGLALVAATALIIWLGQQHPLQYDRWPETRANALVRLAWLAVALGAIAVVAGLGARAVRERLLAAGALLVLLAADPLTHQPNQMPRLSADFLTRFIVMTDGHRRWPALGEGRVFLSPEREQILLQSSVENWGEDTFSKRIYFWSHLNLLDAVPKVNGSSNLRLRDQDALQRRLYPTNHASNPAHGPMLDFLSVTCSARGVGSWSHPDPKPVPLPRGMIPATMENTNRAWIARTTALPLVFAGVLPEFRDPLNTLEALPGVDFNPRRMVYLPPEAQGSVPTNSANARVITRRFAAHEILAEVETDAPTLVTVAQSFYHPWRAFVDGQPVKLWRANYAFQALAVPAGKHTVRLAYVDERFRLGVGISLAGLAVCGWLWWRGGRIPVGDDVRSLASTREKVRDS